MVVALLAAMGWAQGCPDLAERTSSARAAFDDAELEQARAALAAGYEALKCLPRVATADELLTLYRLDGLVSLAQADRKGATYATIRAVAADHVTGAPPAEYGPDLAQEYALWAGRLGTDLIYVRVAGAGTVWIDGRELDASRWMQVAEGEHVVQVRANGTLRSDVLELTEDHVVVTGEPGPNPVLLPEPAPVPAPGPAPIAVAPVPVPGAVPAPAPPTGERGPRRRPAGLFIGAVLSAGAGAAGIVWGSMREEAFSTAVYDAPVYHGCAIGSSCYADARLRAIHGDASLINAAYGTGYGLCALGGALLTTGVVGVPGRPTSLSVSWTF